MSNFIDFEPIKVTLYDWLNSAVNSGDDTTDDAVPIIRAEAEGDGPRPDEGKLFIEYKFLTGLVKIGGKDELKPKLDSGGNPTPDGVFLLRGQRSVTVSVTCFGENAAGCMAVIQQSLSSPVECSILRAGGLAVRNDEAIADATVFQETNFEERATLDVVFGFTLESEIDPGTIESTEFTSNLPGGKKSTIDKNNGITIEDP